MTQNYKHSDLTEQIIRCFYTVYNSLGYGFLEKVYKKALLLELVKNDFSCKSQCPIKVYYNGQIVGEYFADVIVEELIIIELKAVEYLAEEHEFQLINYLKATDIEVGLLLNFGKNPEIKRKVFSNHNKKNLTKS